MQSCMRTAVATYGSAIRGQKTQTPLPGRDIRSGIHLIQLIVRAGAVFCGDAGEGRRVMKRMVRSGGSVFAENQQGREIAFVLNLSHLNIEE
jgi:hypothetical protein